MVRAFAALQVVLEEADGVRLAVTGVAGDDDGSAGLDDASDDLVEPRANVEFPQSANLHMVTVRTLVAVQLPHKGKLLVFHDGRHRAFLLVHQFQQVRHCRVYALGDQARDALPHGRGRADRGKCRRM